MSIDKQRAVSALTILLAELPAEFSTEPPGKGRTRESFKVIKQRNVHTVHAALWELQLTLGMKDES